jgi:N-acetylglutamate synthase-like GNAT family acetyltransferase
VSQKKVFAGKNFLLRPATRLDLPAIWALILRFGLNPLGIHWRRFVVAEDEAGRLLGIGQIKLHGDGSRELASIGVQIDARGKGIGGAIIERLIETQPLPLYLTCRDSMEGYYNRFGFTTITDPNQMPPYFRRLARLADWLVRLTPTRNRMLVMVKR